MDYPRSESLSSFLRKWEEHSNDEQPESSSQHHDDCSRCHGYEEQSKQIRAALHERVAHLKEIEAILKYQRNENSLSNVSATDTKSHSIVKLVELRQRPSLEGCIPSKPSKGVGKEKTFLESTFSSKQRSNKVPAFDNYFPEPTPPSLQTRLQTESFNLQEGDNVRKNQQRLKLKTCQKETLKSSSNADLLPHLSSSKETINITSPFTMSPSKVIFDDFRAGKSYTLIVELKNITSASRQIRIVPPRTSQFNIQNVMFPSENNVVAPGMTCRFNVTFFPDCLSELRDEIKINTHDGRSLIIPVSAKLTPPQLTLPDVINCGYCLVGERSVECLPFVNNGGNTVIAIQSSLVDADTISSSSGNRGPSAIRGPFSVHFDSCTINSGDQSTLKIYFEPTTVKAYEELVTVEFNNGDIHSYTLKGAGEFPTVVIGNRDELCSSYSVQENKDVSSQMLTRFHGCHPGYNQCKTLDVISKCGVPLSYIWKLTKPLFGTLSCSGDRDSKTKLLHPEHRHPALDPSFIIDQSEGVLQPFSSCRMQLSFNPRSVFSFNATAFLLLQSVNNQSFDLNVTSQNESPPASHVSTCIEIKANSSAFDVTVTPPIVFPVGRHPINAPFIQYMELNNLSSGSTAFRWSQVEEEDVTISINPSEGTIQGGETLSCCLTAIASVPQSFTRLLRCHVDHCKGELPLTVKISFEGPTVDFLETHLDFGLVRFGCTAIRTCTLRNTNAGTANWNLDAILSQNTNAAVSLEPSSGQLQSGEEQVISVAMTTSRPVQLNIHIVCHVDSGDDVYLQLSADVQRPLLCLCPCAIEIENSFVGVPLTASVTLFNQSLLPTSFKWRENSEAAAKNVLVSFDPSEGDIDPRQAMNITILFCAKEQGPVRDLLALCDVTGMQHPLLLSMCAVVRGAQLEVAVRGENGALQTVSHDAGAVEFGTLEIGATSSRQIVIRNSSAIPTSFSLSVENFAPPRVPSPPLHGNAKENGSRSIAPRLAADKTKPLPKNRVTADQRAKGSLLTAGHGVVFNCTPARDTVPPFSETVVDITAHSDMWGSYSDVIKCRLLDLDTVNIPVSIDVIGCPLSFVLSNEQTPIVRFGSHLPGGAKVTRRVKVVNSSHQDIRLDWRCFVVEHQDEALVDMDVFFGNPLPLLDNHGNEIEEGNPSDDHPLIKVELHEHVGLQCDVPFSISPTQLTVPGRSHQIFDMSFEPDRSIEAKEYYGFGLGYMTLHKEDACIQGKVHRLHGIDMFPFTVNFHGKINKARLRFEGLEGGRMTFEMSAGQLLSKSKDAGQLFEVEAGRKHVERFVLINTSQTSISFAAQEQFPFSFTDRNGASVGGGLKRSNFKSGESYEFFVGCTLENGLLKSDHHTRSDGGCNDDIITIEKDITFTFSNGESQTVTAALSIHLPKLQLDSRLLDFGLCHVGQTRELFFVIRNKSRCDEQWEIRKDSAAPLSCADAFSVSQGRGHLQGDIDVAVNSSQRVTVRFTPSQAVEYECFFFIDGLLKTTHGSVCVRGKGCYDEAVHKTRNILEM